MLRVFSLESGRMICAPDGPLAPGREPPANALWYDLHDPTDAERAFVDARARVEVPTRADVEEIEVSSRLYRENGAEYMTINAITGFQSPEGPQKTPVMFILSEDTLVTLRYAHVRPFENVAERAARNGGIGSRGEQIMLALIEALVDRLADALEQIGGDIDGISRRVFRAKVGSSRAHGDLEATIAMVGRQGEVLGLVRESLVSFNRLIGYHEGSGPLGLTGEAKGRTKTIARDVASLSDHASYLGGKVAFLLDATLGLINLEQNQIIKIFSIAAVCLMPPTLVASVYGMNFKHIPELDWEFGYPMALVMMLVTGLAPYLYFKRRGWL